MRHATKKGIFLTARVHPGEPNASYMIRGAIEFLLSDCREAKCLRKNLVIKIVPMLNPDGVVYGNYRCSLLGVDLNRRWKHPNNLMHPTIYFTKKMIQIFSEEREIALFCDFHGHSIKKDVFTYACCYKQSDVYKVKENLLIRLIPFLLAKKNANFSNESSRFRLEKSKTGTGRIVNFKDLKILNSYTLEASFFGNSHNDLHFSIDDLEKIGKDLCLQFSVFFIRREFRSQIKQLSDYLQRLKPEKNKITETKSSNFAQDEDPDANFCIKEEIQNIEEVDLNELMIDEEDDSGGSDSQASLNDDRKIKFLLKKVKKNKKLQKISESPARSSKILNSSGIGHNKNSLTPENVPRSRPRSRNSFKRRGEVIKQIIPTKIMLKSPFIEENTEIRAKQNTISTKSSMKIEFKESGQLKPLRKLEEILKELGLTDTFSRPSFKKQKSIKHS